MTLDAFVLKNRASLKIWQCSTNQECPEFAGRLDWIYPVTGEEMITLVKGDSPADVRALLADELSLELDP